MFSLLRKLVRYLKRQVTLDESQRLALSRVGTMWEEFPYSFKDPADMWREHRVRPEAFCPLCSSFVASDGEELGSTECPACGCSLSCNRSSASPVLLASVRRTYGDRTA